MIIVMFVPYSYGVTTYTVGSLLFTIGNSLFA